VDVYTEFLSIAYPALTELGLCVNKLGRYSIIFEVGISEQGEDEVKAVASCVHVFVEYSTGRPPQEDRTTKLRQALEKLYVGYN
jgi:acyl-CoA thioester hydrolase